MKAAILTNFGNKLKLEEILQISTYSVPKIEDDEVLVKMKFASLNHRDLWITKGLYANIKVPIILGSDGAGIIFEKGKNVVNFSIGDDVIINPSLNWGDNEIYQSKDYRILGMPDNGTFTEFVRINCKNVFKKPEHLTLEESAALPLAGLTAYRSVITKAKLQKNDNVLITGIGGGVATFAMLFSLKIGAKIFVTSGNEEKIKNALSLGVKKGVNYKRENWGTDLSNEKINVIVDGSGGKTISDCLSFCEYGTRIVSYGATLGNVGNFDMRKLFWKQIHLMGTTMGSNKDFEEMLNFIQAYKIKPQIDSIYKLEDIHQAFERMNTAEQFGKIIISI